MLNQSNASGNQLTCKFHLPCSWRMRISFAILAYCEICYFLNFKFVAKYRMIGRVHTWSHQLVLHSIFSFQWQPNQTKWIYCIQRDNSTSKYYFRSRPFMRVNNENFMCCEDSRMSSTASHNNNYYYLAYVSAPATKKPPFNWYYSKVVKSKHPSTALMTFSHFVRKCFDFMVCVGLGNITMKTTHTHPFSLSA